MCAVRSVASRSLTGRPVSCFVHAASPEVAGEREFLRVSRSSRSFLMLVAAVVVAGCDVHLAYDVVGSDPPADAGPTAPGCASPKVACGSECADLMTDARHCKTCDHACPQGFACDTGECVCAPPMARCGESCVDTRKDAAHCGGCERPCGPGYSCAGGQCACSSPNLECVAGCVDITKDASNCGRCDRRCRTTFSCLPALPLPPAPVKPCRADEGTGCCRCLPSQTDCGDCTDTQTDAANCGDCYKSCAPTELCKGGKCVCPDGQQLCDAAGCVDLSVDPRHCGGCDTPCAAPRACSGGRCP